MSRIAAIVRKDLILEMRGAQSTVTMLSISLLVLVVLVFALDARAGRTADAAAGALWVALVFSGMLGASRTLDAERENGCMGALVASPIDPSSIFLAKLCATFIFMAIAETASVVLMVLFFNLDFDAHTARVVPVLAMGTLGFSALATLTAAVAGRTRLGDLIVPILAVPMFVPALIAGVKASAGAMTGAPWDVIAVWIRILLAFDVLFVASGWMLFEYVARGD